MKAGETISNRITGESLTMLVSEEESGGARQLYQVNLPARRPSPPVHYHVDFAETFSVIDGALDMYLGPRREHIILYPGESATAVIGQLHTFANPRDEPAVITVETRPAGGVVRAFQLAYAVANDGGAAQDGLPGNPLLRLIFIRTSQGYIPRIPRVVQRFVFALAALIAKVTGVEKKLATKLNAPSTSSLKSIASTVTSHADCPSNRGN